MASSNASTSRTITFNRRMGNINAFISCDQGDVYFDYKNADSTDASNYVPQLTTSNKRTLELNVSDTLGAALTIGQVKWFYNSKPIPTGSDSDLRLYFIPRGSELDIVGPVPAITSNGSINITCEAEVGKSGSPEKAVVYASYMIPVRQWTANAYRVTILAVDKEANYTIKNSNGISVRCAVYDDEGAEVTEGVTCEWSKLGTDATHLTPDWLPMGQTTSAGNNNVLSINEADVDNQAMFRVVAYIGGNKAGEDVQMIYDNHDPYVIQVIADPTDETIYEGDTARNKVQYQVNIATLTTVGMQSAVQPKRARFSFFLCDSTGNNIVEGGGSRQWRNIPWVSSPAYKTGEFAQAKQSSEVIFTVYEVDCRNAGDLILNISAEIVD